MFYTNRECGGNENTNSEIVGEGVKKFINFLFEIGIQEGTITEKLI